MTEFKEYSSYPENNNNNIEQGMESITISEVSNYKNPTLLSDEMNYNEEDVIVNPTKYVKPKYREVQKTYKVLKPIIKETVTLPVKIKEKVKIIDPIYNKTIIINGENGYNNIIEYDKKDYPLPTQSTIQNLCKESVIGSENYYSSYLVPKNNDPESNPFQTQSTTQNLGKQYVNGSENYYGPYQELKNYDPGNMIEGNPVPNDETYDNNINTNIAIPKETYQTVYMDNLNENQKQNNYQDQHYKQKDEHKSFKDYPSKNKENKFQSTNVNDNYISKPQMSKAINANNDYKNTKSDNLKIEYQHFNISKRPNNEYQKSKIEHQQNIIINNTKNNNYQSLNKENNKKSKQITESHISHVQIKKLPNIKEQDINKYQSKIYQPNLFENNYNKNLNDNVEEEDDDIPKPIVYEGESLEKSEIKEENENMIENNNLESNNNMDDINNIFKQSAEQEPERHYSKIKKIETNNFFENLPLDQTEIMSKPPSIEIPNVQKVNMTQNSEKFSFKPPQESQQFHQSKLEQSNINQKSLYPSKMQMAKQSKIGQKSIRVQKIESNSHFYSKNNYNYDIPRNQSIPESNNVNQANINQVKESNKYQQPFQHSNINDMDDIQKYNNYDLNNQSNKVVGQMSKKSYYPEEKSSFPTASYCGSTIISKSKIPPNPFEEEDNIEKSSVPFYENKVKIIKK